MNALYSSSSELIETLDKHGIMWVLADLILHENFKVIYEHNVGFIEMNCYCTPNECRYCPLYDDDSLSDLVCTYNCDGIKYFLYTSQEDMEYLEKYIREKYIEYGI